LIYQVKEKVLDKTGTNLELELQIIGEKLWVIWLLYLLEVYPEREK
jgi:hypothetical protein